MAWKAVPDGQISRPNVYGVNEELETDRKPIKGVVSLTLTSGF